MSATTPQGTRHTLMHLEEDDWVGKLVLVRERALMVPEALPETAQGEERALNLILEDVHASGFTLDSPSSQGAEAVAFLSETERSEPVSSVALPGDDEGARRFHCTESECNGSFTRKSDLSRHKVSFHERDKRFACLAVGCFKKHTAPTFTRGDKLAAHIRTVHHQPGARFRCFGRHCQSQENLSLPELAVHLDIIDGAQVKLPGGQHPRWLRRSRHEDSDIGIAVAIHNARQWRRCRIWSCSVSKFGHEYVDHLKTHSLDELQAASAQLASEGIEFIAADSLTPPSTDAESQPYTLIPARCPLGSCQARPECEKTFAKHILSEHLLQQDLAIKEHFLTGFVDDISWRKPHMRHPNGGTLSSGVCRRCGLEDWQHYQSFFRPLQDVIAELEPHRVLLLHLCPDLAVHQIYDYLRD
ncbi:hypothetical protein B0A48_16608 [Cryoendolithus antarcticus]|uniref:C2H2-type domain-containing protein n=1 Tax=Cryoendolithus antarcticus TaxID=1507870 RepID=A0A1V8SEF6_9PEZI|nr:hypothetical protein B0A48_16608 [Cryoendolithus antarcticus]